MTLNIHVTVELQPSPQLVELFQAMQPRQPERLSQADKDRMSPMKPSMGETEGLLHPGTERPMSELDKFMKERKELKRQDLKPQEAQEEPKDPEPILECFKSFLLPKERPEFISLDKYNKYLSYFRRGGMICIQYRASRIFTAIDLIKQMGDTVPEHIRFGDFLKRPQSNQRTAIKQFWFAMERGLDLDTLVDEIDPDAAFKQQLTPGTIDTSTGYDGGKLEGSLED